MEHHKIHQKEARPVIQKTFCRDWTKESSDME